MQTPVHQSAATDPAPKRRPPLATVAQWQINQQSGACSSSCNTKNSLAQYRKPVSRTSRPSSAIALSHQNTSRSKAPASTSASTRRSRGSKTAAIHTPTSSKGFETDATATTELWSLVMAPRNQQSGLPVASKRGLGKGKAGSVAGSTKSIHSSGSQHTAMTEESGTACGPGHRMFEEGVLAPRGITISREGIFTTPFAHFCTKQPPEDGESGAHYCAQPRLQHSTIWLDRKQEFVEDIREEYFIKKDRRRPEAEFAVTGHQKLLRAERMRLKWPTHRHFLPERYLQPTLKPIGHLWAEPPITRTDISIRPYAFDIRPDCTYWISLQAFSSRYRHVAKSVVHIYSDDEGMLCPYLTVEFKKDTSNLTKAEHQVAAAGSIALYNRCSLHQRRLSRTEEGFDKIQWRKIRHYGLTFSGPTYSIWCLEPIVCHKTGDWQGCRMFVLSGGRCSNEDTDVENLIDWLNEIHAWGLGVHGPEVEMDLKVILKQEPGAPRTSLSDDEVEKLSRISLDEMNATPSS